MDNMYPVIQILAKLAFLDHLLQILMSGTNQSYAYRDRGFPADALVIGDTAEVAQRFAELAEMGFTDVIVRNISAEQPEALATIERLAMVQARVAEL